MGVVDRLKHAWNAFVDRADDPFGPKTSWDYGPSYGSAPHIQRRYIGGERTIISSIYMRLAIDAATTDIRHVRLDDENRYIEDMDTGLQECLTVEANIDQAALAFKIDVFMTMFEKGHAAVVPVDTTLNPKNSGSWDVKTMRVGEVVDWFPEDVKVSVYNEQTGRREEVILPKRMVAIVYNPLYTVMNEPNSTLQRLIRKLQLLDVVDEQSSSGKLDLIIQLPYTVKSELQRSRAEQRRKDMEWQLKGSQYGIAYADATEKVTQLNRPAENQLLKQVEYLHTLLYAQLGLTAGVMDGSADEAAILNYYDRTIEPILDSFVGEMKRKFLTKTARSQKQSILYFRVLFKLVPIKDVAELADKFTRNEIASSNEFRQVLGWKPSKDPKADQLRNSNMPQSELGVEEEGADDPAVQDVLAGLSNTLDGIFTDLGIEDEG
jgi:hypothetical protein